MNTEVDVAIKDDRQGTTLEGSQKGTQNNNKNGDRGEETYRGLPSNPPLKVIVPVMLIYKPEMYNPGFILGTTFPLVA